MLDTNYKLNAKGILIFISFNLLLILIATLMWLYLVKQSTLNVKIDESDYFLIPGEQMIRTISVKNEGIVHIYYSFYFRDIKEKMNNDIMIYIYNENTLLFKGKMIDFNEDNAFKADEALGTGEIHTYKIVFEIENSVDNECENQSLSFDLISKIELFK